MNQMFTNEIIKGLWKLIVKMLDSKDLPELKPKEMAIKEHDPLEATYRRRISTKFQKYDLPMPNQWLERYPIFVDKQGNEIS